MRIAVVGNRTGWTMDFVFSKLLSFNITKNDIIVSGGADGVDTYAQEFAKKMGCQIRIFYPDPDKASPQRYFDRNEQIALGCDRMIAFDKEEGGSGTKNAISHAQKLGKDVFIVDKMDKKDMDDKSDIENGQVQHQEG